MVTVGVLARLEAKAGKEEEVSRMAGRPQSSRLIARPRCDHIDVDRDDVAGGLGGLAEIALLSVRAEFLQRHGQTSTFKSAPLQYRNENPY